MTIRKLLTLCLVAGLVPVLAVLPLPANAQTVYKCSSDGKISYGEAPCPGGSNGTVLQAPAPPATRDLRETTRLRQQGEQLMQQRHRREARDEQAQQHADKAAAKQRDRCASLKLQRQWAQEDATPAKSGKDAGKAELKARRAAEKFAILCPS